MMGTDKGCCHLLGDITLIGVCGLCDVVIHDQVVAVVQQYLCSLVELRWVDIGFTDQ